MTMTVVVVVSIIIAIINDSMYLFQFFPLFVEGLQLNLKLVLGFS